jgi:hypothetical protein
LYPPSITLVGIALVVLGIVAFSDAIIWDSEGCETENLRGLYGYENYATTYTV